MDLSRPGRLGDLALAIEDTTRQHPSPFQVEAERRVELLHLFECWPNRLALADAIDPAPVPIAKFAPAPLSFGRNSVGAIPESAASPRGVLSAGVIAVLMPGVHLLRTLVLPARAQWTGG